MLPPRAEQSVVTRKYRDTYARVPGCGFVQKDFGLWMCLESWKQDGLPDDVDVDTFFYYEKGGRHALGGLGWCEAAFCPDFPVVVLEDRGDTEVVQDRAGRQVLYFKGRRQAFMPEYLSHPVRDWQSWEAVRPRLDFSAPGRLERLQQLRDDAVAATAGGEFLSQQIIGGYMYLRSLMGPEEVLYMFYDQPDLIHACMQSWLELADRVTAWYQQVLVYDEVFLGEDICFNHGPLIAPEMIRVFLLPYYQQLLANIRGRQRDRSRPLYIQLDSDGDCRGILELYQREAGFTVFSPLEVASGCDVVAMGRQYPELVFSGGFDKRILAAGPAAIDREVDRIFPVMHARGGYFPTCDHGVPPEVNWRDYLHFRRRCLEFSV